MFSGVTNLSMDAKGRLIVPAKHRDVLLAESADKLVLTSHIHPCLLLYPEQAWDPIAAKIMALSSFDMKSAALQRRVVGYADHITLDASGRLLVSPELRDLAALKKDVVMVGQGSHFELWDAEAWRKQLGDAVADGVFEMPKELEGFSL